MRMSFVNGTPASGVPFRKFVSAAPHPPHVMAGLVPAIHWFTLDSGGLNENVDARNESGHDDV